jgi:hypothetical protein
MADYDNGIYELDYIQTTGNTPIDLGIKASSEYVINMKFVMNYASGDCFLGNRNVGERDTFRFFGYSNSWYLDYGSGNNYNRINGGYGITNSNGYEIQIGNRYIKNLSTGKNIISGSSVSSFTKSYNVYAFYSDNEKGKIYYIEFVKDGTTIAKYIPCLNYGVVCLYEEIEKKFYYSSGTGKLTYGSVVRPIKEVHTYYLFGDSSDKLYTVVNDETLTEVDAELTADTFMTYGVKTIYGDLIKSLDGLKIYKWTDDDDVSLHIKMNAIPLPQYVSCVADMSYESIKGITSIGCSYDGTVNIQYSYDGTTYTSKMSVTDFLAISPDTLYDGLGIENKIYFKFWLEDDTSALTNLVIRYQNTE